MKKGLVKAVSKSEFHTFHKLNCDKIFLLEGLGVAGDAHMGITVKHRSRVAKDPKQPNLRQIHLIHSELFIDLKEKGFDVKAGEMGENITTQGIDLLNLPEHTILKIGKVTEIKITGLRNPCKQIDNIQKGLMKAVLGKDSNGNLIRKAGIMGVVIKGGEIKKGDNIDVFLPKMPFLALEVV